MDTKPKTLTKTQIGYFSNRIMIIAMHVREEVKTKCEEMLPKELTSQEKIEMVASGKAELKYDKLMKSVANGWALGSFDDAFDFPGDCEATMIRKKEAERLKKFLSTIDDDAKKITDAFVLGRIVDPDQSIDDFEKRAQMYIERFQKEKPLY